LQEVNILLYEKATGEPNYTIKRMSILYALRLLLLWWLNHERWDWSSIWQACNKTNK